MTVSPNVKPRAVLAEDEPLLREQLAELLAAAWPELEIVAQAEDGKQALHALEAHRPDVLFLDIQMPEASGLEVARRASGRCHVVFVTAYDQYAVAAFEEGAVDYVMKPLSGARIAAAAQRVKQRMRESPANLTGMLDELANPPSRSRQYLRWINASRGDDVQLVTIEEVRYFQSDMKYTRVVTAKREGLIRKTIKELVEELDPAMFWQMHRATIVNLNAVESVGRDLKGHVILRLKDRPELLSVSQPYAHLFRQM
ncbi:MAG: LytTR family DNA-binding domain-containing protein [Usitatibacter sp.]